MTAKLTESQQKILILLNRILTVLGPQMAWMTAQEVREHCWLMTNGGAKRCLLKLKQIGLIEASGRFNVTHGKVIEEYRAVIRPVKL